MRAAAIVATVGALALVAASAVLAQGSPPTITITASETTLNVGATSPVAAGPTRFDIVKGGGEEVDVTIGALRAGVTLEQFTAALRADPESAIELVHIDGGASLTAGDEHRAVTFNLRANSTYVVVNDTETEDPADLEVASFTVGGQSNGATAPVADANVRIVDLRFEGAKTLPRDGVVRFTNAGWAPHFAFAAPVKRGVKTKRVVRALRKNNEKQLERLLNFANGVEPQALITRGAVNYNEVTFPRRGRYAMICFFDGHHTQGMWRIIRVN